AGQHHASQPVARPAGFTRAARPMGARNQSARVPRNSLSSDLRAYTIPPASAARSNYNAVSPRLDIDNPPKEPTHAKLAQGSAISRAGSNHTRPACVISDHNAHRTRDGRRPKQQATGHETGSG